MQMERQAAWLRTSSVPLVTKDLKKAESETTDAADNCRTDVISRALLLERWESPANSIRVVDLYNVMHHARTTFARFAAGTYELTVMLYHCLHATAHPVSFWRHCDLSTKSNWFCHVVNCPVRADLLSVSQPRLCRNLWQIICVIWPLTWTVLSAIKHEIRQPCIAGVWT